MLRERFGTVHVNVGEPIRLNDMLDAQLPKWREQRFDDDTRLPAVNALVDELALAHHAGHQRGGRRHAHQPAGHGVAGHAARRDARERAAAPARPVPEAAARIRRTAPRVTVTDATPAEIVEYGESLKIISRVPHKLGDVVKMSDESAQLIAYYRNNVLHLFALPSLVACAFIGNSMLRTEDIQRLAWRIYPYVASELFLRWREDELARVVDGVLAALAEHGVLQPNEDRSVWMRPPPDSPAAMQLSMLAQATIQTIERYYLAISLLLKAGSGAMTQKALEERVPAGGPAHEHAVRIQLARILRSFACSRISSTCCASAAWSGSARAAIWNSTKCWCASPPTRSSCSPNRYATASCRSRGSDWPGNPPAATGLASLPRKAAAILARNTSAPRRPRGEAAARQNTKTIRTSGKSALASSLVAVPRSAGEINE